MHTMQYPVILRFLRRNVVYLHLKGLFRNIFQSHVAFGHFNNDSEVNA